MPRDLLPPAMAKPGSNVGVPAPDHGDATEASVDERDLKIGQRRKGGQDAGGEDSEPSPES